MSVSHGHFGHFVVLQIDLHTLGEHLNDTVVIVGVHLEKAGHILLQQFVTELRILSKRWLFIIPNGQEVAVISANNEWGIGISK